MSSNRRWLGVKRPWKSSSLSAMAGDLPDSFSEEGRGGVPDRYVGDRDRRFAKGGVPDTGGVVMPLMVTLSMETLGLLGWGVGFDPPLFKSSIFFFLCFFSLLVEPLAWRSLLFKMLIPEVRLVAWSLI